MANAYGVPQPHDAEDYQQFMLGLYDLVADAGEIARPELRSIFSIKDGTFC